MKKISLLIFLMLILPNVFAASSMKLLAVRDEGNNFVGSVADLYLKIQPGTGRIFLETYPLTKLDTQLSTRFAKEIACSFLETNCDNYDFFYTINAESGIVGGPSAGAAIAVLTIAEIDGLNLDENMAITGTINSGGFIGFVGGIKGKIDAASKAGITKVLVASGNIEITKDNETINLKKYAKKKGVEIIDVSSLGQAVYEFTGKYKQKTINNISTNPEYEKTMHKVALSLCNRTASLKKQLKKVNINYTNNLTEKAQSAIKNKEYYTAASYCFGANYKYNSLLFENISDAEISKKMISAKKEIQSFNLSLDNVKTITDFQTYIIAKNRLNEAEEYLNKISDEMNNSEKRAYDLAYAVERISSAKSWMNFFGKGGKQIKLNTDTLKNGCLDKLGEAEERYSYAMLYFPASQINFKSKIDKVKKYLSSKEYGLCLFEASKAKASINILLSSIGVKKEQIQKIIDLKMNLVKIALNKQIKQGIWPIMGYSYYEYANSLRKNDPYSALLYAEYALELSDLDPYLKEKPLIQQKNIIQNPNTTRNYIIIFFLGIIGGYIISIKLKSKTLNPRERFRRTSVSGKKR